MTQLWSILGPVWKLRFPQTAACCCIFCPSNISPTREISMVQLCVVHTQHLQPVGYPSVEPRSMFLPINFICNGSISLHLIVFVCICCCNPDVPYWVLSPPIWFLTSKLIGLPYRRCWMVIPPSNPGRLLVNFPQSVTCYLVSLHMSSKLKEECVFISLHVSNYWPLTDCFFIYYLYIYIYIYIYTYICIYIHIYIYLDISWNKPKCWSPKFETSVHTGAQKQAKWQVSLGAPHRWPSGACHGRWRNPWPKPGRMIIGLSGIQIGIIY